MNAARRARKAKGSLWRAGRIDRRRGPRVRPLSTLLLALGMIIALQARRVPLWVPPLALALGVWRLHLERLRKRLPGRGFLYLLAVLGTAAVVLSVPEPFSRDTALSLLILFTGLKLLEMRGERDRFVLVFLGFFLAFTVFLYDQSVSTALVVAVAVLILTAAWIDLLRASEHLTFGGSLRLSTQLLAQAVPTTLALFLFVPRVSAPLWALPASARGAVSGLSDSMSPGSIGRLTLSNAVAFRVMFDEPPPPPALRYWRGPVLDATDGVTWRRSASEGAPGPAGAARSLGPPDQEIDYTVTLEPHPQRWLLALDLPTAAPEGATLAADYTLVSRSAVTRRLRYSVRSQLAYNTGDLGRGERLRTLQLPRRVSARVRSLAESWRSGGAGDAQVVQRALRYFARGGYVYTLTPPPVRGDPVEQFLFETRKGFCEHYSGAFTLLMRLDGIPARVVTGYQGGEFNPLGGYWIVREADAHAWSEVWLAGRGWVRIDPTAVVAPDRTDFPIDNRAEEGGAAVRFLRGSGRLLHAYRELRYAWDSLDNTWNQWMLGYDSERQYAVFTRLGFGDPTWRAVALALGLSVGLLLLLVAWETLRTRPPPADPVHRVFNRYCRRLARRGLPRLPHEGPATYADRVCREREALTGSVREITDLYLGLRYGGSHAPGALAVLRRRVFRFRP